MKPSPRPKSRGVSHQTLPGAQRYIPRPKPKSKK